MPFKKGSKGGPGRPKRAVEATYHEAFKKAVSEEDFIEIIKAIAAVAKKGDSIWAAKFITEYLIGMPQQRTEVEQTTEHSGGIQITITEQKTPTPELTDDDD